MPSLSDLIVAALDQVGTRKSPGTKALAHIAASARGSAADPGSAGSANEAGSPQGQGRIQQRYESQAAKAAEQQHQRIAQAQGKYATDIEKAATNTNKADAAKARLDQRIEKAQEQYERALSKAAQDMDRRTQKMLDKFTTVSPPKARQPAGRAAQAAGGDGSSLLGMIGGFGPGLAAGGAFAGLKFLEAGFERMSRAADILGNSTLNSSQKLEQLGTAMPVVGGLFQSVNSFFKNASGLTDFYRRLPERYELASTEIATRGTAQRQYYSAAHDAMVAQQRAAAFQTLGPLSPWDTARSSFAEQQAYARTRRLGPLDDAVQRAQAEVTAARGAAALAATAAVGHDERVRALRAERDALSGQQRQLGALGPAASNVFNRYAIGSLGNPTQMAAFYFAGQQAQGVATEGLLQARLRGDEVNQALQTSEAALNRQKETSLALAQREADLRGTVLERTRASLGDLESREAQALGNAQRIGRMTPIELAQSRFAFQMAGQMGLDNLPPELRDLAERFAPDEMRARYEQLGERRISDQGLRQLAPEQFANALTGPDNIRDQVDRAMQAVREAQRENDTALAQNLHRVFQDFADRIYGRIEDLVRDATNRVQVGQSISHAMQ